MSWHERCLNCERGVEIDRTVFLSKQFCFFVVVARLNSRKESENKAGAVIFDVSVAEYIAWH